MSLRLIFMGTPDFALSILTAVIGAGHRVVAAYSQPPRPAGRGQQTRPSPVHAFALSKGIPVRTPKTLKSSESQAEFAAWEADAAVVAAYGLILPKPVLAAPRLGCINVHASLLPRWRGAAPIQRAILAGDRETGVTIMQMDEGLDTGGMVLAEKLPITPATTGAVLHDALAELGAGLIVRALDQIESGRASATPQPATGATYAVKLAKDEARLDWGRPAVELERTVRAFTPWPGAWFEHGRERFKVLAAACVAASGPTGQILDDRLTVACGEGALRLDIVQRAGKAPLDSASFLRGYPLPAGTVLARPCPATN